MDYTSKYESDYKIKPKTEQEQKEYDELINKLKNGENITDLEGMTFHSISFNMIRNDYIDLTVTEPPKKGKWYLPKPEFTLNKTPSNFDNSNMSNSKFLYCSFTSNSSFCNTNFKNSYFYSTHFSYSRFENVDFTGSVFKYNTNFTHCLFENVQFDNAIFTWNVTFSGCKFKNCSFKDVICKTGSRCMSLTFCNIDVTEKEEIEQLFTPEYFSKELVHFHGVFDRNRVCV